MSDIPCSLGEVGEAPLPHLGVGAGGAGTGQARACVPSPARHTAAPLPALTSKVVLQGTLKKSRRSAEQPHNAGPMPGQPIMALLKSPSSGRGVCDALE